MDSNAPGVTAVGNFDEFGVTPIVGTTNIPWTSRAPSSIRRFEGYGRSVGGKLYVFGGYTQIDPFDSTSDYAVYDPATNAWTDLGTMPVPETHAGVAVDDSTGTIYFVGGLRGTYPGVPTTDVYAYSTTTNAWTQLPSLPQALGAGTADFVKGVLHYVGGIGSASRSLDLNVHYMLKIGDTQWQTAAPLPVARDHLSSATLNGKIYVFGGEVGHDTDHLQQTLAQVYDPATNIWTQLPDMPQGKSHMECATFVWNGKIILAGGQADNFQSTSTILQYDPAANSWSMLAPLPMGLQGEIVQPLAGKLFVAAGYDGLVGIPSTATWSTPWM
jgi:N-acetylneuraminic acid mutarotase